MLENVNLEALEKSEDCNIRNIMERNKNMAWINVQKIEDTFPIPSLKKLTLQGHVISKTDKKWVVSLPKGQT